MGRSLKLDILLVDNWYASASQIIYMSYYQYKCMKRKVTHSYTMVRMPIL